MDKFYIIKLINREGERGYLMDTPKGIMIIKDGAIGSITQFKTYQDAQEFLRERKVERRGVKAYIRDNEDLMKDSECNFAKPIDSDVFYLENEQGHKCFYDAKQEGYYFDKPDVGYCVWKTEDQLRTFVEAMDFKVKTIIKKLEK